VGDCERECEREVGGAVCGEVEALSDGIVERNCWRKMEDRGAYLGQMWRWVRGEEDSAAGYHLT
jgi:hypothetical protein